MAVGKFELFKDRKGAFRFRLVARNGEVILASGAYTRKSSAKDGIASVQTNCGIDDRFVRKETRGGKHHFVLRGANNKIVGTSERYETAQAMEKGIQAVGRCGVTDVVDDTTRG